MLKEYYTIFLYYVRLLLQLLNDNICGGFIMEQSNDLASEHTALIQKKLNVAKEKYEARNGIPPLGMYTIQTLLKKHFENGYIPTIPTITKLFKATSFTSSINITLIAELCSIFNADLSYILALPGDTNNIIQDTKIEYNEHFKPLTDEFYLGDFNCYMLRVAYASDDNAFSTKNDTLRKNDSLVHCSLHIGLNDMNEVEAEMVMHNHTVHVDGIDYSSDSRLIGKPIHITETNNIYINFTSENGKYYTVMYDHRIFYNAPMYYREAIVLTSATEDQTLPMVSKMLIFRNKVHSKYNELLLGLLSLNVKNIIISEQKLLDLCRSKNSSVSQFYEEFHDFLLPYKQEFYVIPENIINHNPRSTMTTLELKKVLLILRNHSYSLAQIEVGNDSKASIIGKEIQKYTGGNN